MGSGGLPMVGWVMPWSYGVIRFSLTLPLGQDVRAFGV